MSKKSSTHYVDNAKFLEALKDYRKEFKQHAAAARAYKSFLNKPRPVGRPSKSTPQDPGEEPRVSEYLGDCFLRIATHLSYKPNFAGYTFKDDMISDGVENSLIYIKNFDPEKSSNPFGYFTQIIYYAFLRRIMREKKHTYIRYKLTEQAIIEDSLSTNPSGANSEHTYLNYDNVKSFINKYEQDVDGRKARRRLTKCVTKELDVKEVKI